MRVRSFGLSDIGLVRTVNQDTFSALDRTRLYIVVDGMGGHAHGRTAAMTAITAMLGYLASNAISDVPATDGIHPHTLLLRRSVELANRRILASIDKDPSLLGMGTTVVSAMLHAQVMAIAHVGDSRAYRRRGGKLELLTEDHTYVSGEVRAGRLTEAQARTHPLRNVVTHALGGEGDFRVDVAEFKALPGDLYLLCSDGLTAMLTNRKINRLLAATDAPNVSVSLEEMCHALIQAANALGGYDNVTVVLVQIATDEDERKEECDS